MYRDIKKRLWEEDIFECGTSEKISDVQYLLLMKITKLIVVCLHIHP